MNKIEIERCKLRSKGVKDISEVIEYLEEVRVKLDSTVNQNKLKIAITMADRLKAGISYSLLQ